MCKIVRNCAKLIDWMNLHNVHNLHYLHDLHNLIDLYTRLTYLIDQLEQELINWMNSVTFPKTLITRWLTNRNPRDASASKNPPLICRELVLFTARGWPEMTWVRHKTSLKRFRWLGLLLQVLSGQNIKPEELTMLAQQTKETETVTYIYSSQSA